MSVAKDPKTETAIVKLGGEYPVLAGGGQHAVTLITDSLGGAEITPFDLDTVKMPAGGAVHFSVLNDQGEEDAVKFIEGIVVFQRRQRGFWLKDEPDGSPPDCFSDDAITGIGDRTGNGEASAQECKTCPWAQWGTARKGGKGQACGLKTILFLLRKGEFLPTVVSLPPTSLKVWQKFVMRQASRGHAMTSYEVSIGLEKRSGPSGDYSAIKVTKVRDISADDQKQIVAYAELLRSLFVKVRADMTNDAGDGE